MFIFFFLFQHRKIIIRIDLLHRIPFSIYYHEWWFPSKNFTPFLIQKNINLFIWKTSYTDRIYYIRTMDLQIKYAFCNLSSNMDICAFLGWGSWIMTFPCLHFAGGHSTYLLCKSNRYSEAQQQFAVFQDLLRLGSDRSNIRKWMDTVRKWAGINNGYLIRYDRCLCGSLKSMEIIAKQIFNYQSNVLKWKWVEVLSP